MFPESLKRLSLFRVLFRMFYFFLPSYLKNNAFTDTSFREKERERESERDQQQIILK